MARRNRRAEEQSRELTRKEHRIRSHDRERNQRIMLGTAIAIGLALLVVIFGLASEFIFRPNSSVATVGETNIVTRDFWKRIFLEQNRLQNQYIRLAQLEQQFGGQGFFTSQLNQVQATLSSDFTLGVEVLNQMIREEVIRQQAAARGITVSPEEVEEALREEVAAGQSAVTVPQATSTAEAGSNATATATAWTPTPSPTVDVSATVTATATAIPTPVPPTPLPVLSDEQYQTGLEELEDNLRDVSGMSLDEYRRVLEAQLLNEKLSAAISEEQVTTTEEQVRARHILINIDETEPLTPTAGITSTEVLTGDALTATDAMTATAVITDEAAPQAAMTATTATAGEVVASEDVTATGEITASEATTDAVATDEVTATNPVTRTVIVTRTEVVTRIVPATETVPVTDDAEVTASDEPTATSAVTDTAALTNTAAIAGTAATTDTTAAPEELLNDAEALALAQELRARIIAGEDFATLVQEYSDDTTSVAAGGDLGWFGRGAMVAPFEEAAFSLEPGQISEPIKSDFGYHIIEVLEKDAERPKEESALEQERAEAYQTWLQEQITATPIERPADIVANLPRRLDTFVPVIPTAPAPDPAAVPAPAQ